MLSAVGPVFFFDGDKEKKKRKVEVGERGRATATAKQRPHAHEAKGDEWLCRFSFSHRMRASFARISI
jgi:hypothetical protein